MEEGTGSTELVTDYSDESYSDRCVSMADVGGGRRENELPEDISVDEPTTNAGNENEAERDGMHERNRVVNKGD